MEKLIQAYRNRLEAEKQTELAKQNTEVSKLTKEYENILYKANKVTNKETALKLYNLAINYKAKIKKAQQNEI